MKSLLSLFVLLFSVSIGWASWQKTMDEERTLRLRDDRVFITIDRALSYEQKASEDELPYFKLYTTLLVAEALWSFDVAEARGTSFTPPSQGWTQDQAKTFLKHRFMVELWESRASFTPLTLEKLPLKFDNDFLKWPNQSVWYAVYHYGKRVYHTESDRIALASRMKQVAQETGDEMLEGLVALEQLQEGLHAVTSTQERISRLESFRKERQWPADLQALVLLALAEEYQRDEQLEQAASSLMEALKLTQLATLNQTLSHQLNRIRQASLLIEQLTQWRHPLNRTLSLHYRNVTSVQLTSKTSAEFKPITYSLPAAKEAYTWTTTEITLPELPMGEHKLQFEIVGNVSSEKITESLTLRITPFVVAALNYEHKGYLYIADSLTGAPVENAMVIYRNQTYTSDLQGLVALPFASYQTLRSMKNEMVTFTALGETITLPVRALPAHSWLNLPKAEKATLYTDRALYRPGEKVQWSLLTLAFDHTKHAYAPSPHQTGKLKIVAQDQFWKETCLLESEYTSSDRGLCSGEMQLPEDFSGAVTFKWNGQHLKSMTVAPFRTSTLSLDVKHVNEGKPLTQPILFQIAAKDLSDSPLANAEATWECPNDVNPQLSGKTILDAEGKATIAIALPKEMLKRAHQEVYLSLNVTVTMANGESQTKRFSFTLPKNGLKLDVAIDEGAWLFENQPFTLRFSSNWPTASGEIQIFTESEIKPYHGKTMSARQSQSPLQTLQFNSLKPISLTLPMGRYRIDICAEGERYSHTFITVLPFTREAGQTLFKDTSNLFPLGAFSKSSNEPLEVGSTLKGYALMPGYGKAFWTVLTADGLSAPQPLTSPFFALPITASLGTRFGVFIFAFDKGHWRTYAETFSVKPVETLTLKATIFNDTAKPGSQQTWRVTVDDPNATLIVTCYDKALEAFQKYNWSLLRDAFTFYPFNNLRQSAIYPQERCSLVERLPRLQHSYQNTPRLLGARGGLVLAKSSAADGIAMEPALELDGAAPAFEAPTIHIRNDFRSLAFWVAEKRVQNGEAEFTFTLPDGLTTWRLMAYAFTPDGRSAVLTRDCVAQQAVMLKPYLPRVLHVGDRVTLSVQVDNRTEDTLQTTVTLDGAAPQTVTLLPKGQQNVQWEVAITTPGMRTFQFACAEDAVAVNVPVLNDTIEVEDVYPITLIDTRPTTLEVALPNETVTLTERWDHQPGKAITEALQEQLKDTCQSTGHLFSQLTAALLLGEQAPIGKADELLKQLLTMRQKGQALWPWFVDGPMDPRISAEICIGTARLQLLGKAPSAVLDAVKDTLLHAQKELPFAAWAYACATLNCWPNTQSATVRLLEGYEQASSVQERRLITLAAQRLKVASVAEKGLNEVLSSLNQSELWGCWWPQERYWWRWWHTPLESHVLGWEILQMAGKTKEAKGAAQWLLQHRRLNRWGTSRATNDAIFALLSEKLENQPPCSLSRNEVNLDKHRKSFTFARTAEGVSFGNLTAHYQASISDVVASIISNDDAALSITRTITPLTDTTIGSRLMVTLTITAVQPMSYVHIQAPRPANVETEQQLPSWDWQTGAYRIPGDAGSEIFIHSLKRGVTTLRYTWKVTHAGECLLPPATAKLMYAPDFAARTGSDTLKTEP